MTKAIHLRGKRVLIVEDEPLIGLELAAMLEEAGVDVVGPAASIEQAHHLIVQAVSGLHAALLDVNVAGASINGVCEALAAMAVPFAFMTGYSETEVAGLASGVPVIRKPFTPDQVFEALQLLVPEVSAPATEPGR